MRHHILRPSVSELEFTKSQAKLIYVDIGLQVLDNVIMTKWKVLPKEQQQGQLQQDVQRFTYH